MPPRVLAYLAAPYSTNTLLCSPGVSESDLDDAETRLAVTFPPGYRLLMRLHNGQSLQSTEQASRMEAGLFENALPAEVSGPPSAGLFGG